MFLNWKGWTGRLFLVLILGAITYSISSNAREVLYDQEESPAPVIVGPQVLIGDNTLSVRVATSSQAITKGLSGTLTMAENEGMIFLFKAPDIYRFWMPDMHFALDMIWIGSDNKIVDITKDAPPLKDLTKPVFFSPRSPAKYVLEVHAGWSKKHNITIGEQVELVSI